MRLLPNSPILSREITEVLKLTADNRSESIDTSVQDRYKCSDGNKWVNLRPLITTRRTTLRVGGLKVNPNACVNTNMFIPCKHLSRSKVPKSISRWHKNSV